ncbi:MAG: YgfZ/GcvT domain-containing protein [Hyphomicrobiaceae bacterium]
MGRIAHLPHRSVIRVSGPEAVKFLDSMVTNNLTLLNDQSALHTGLLSPQGKILFDFFVVQAGEDLLLDVPAAQLDNLINRLKFYRLRANVAFIDESKSLAVWVMWPADHLVMPNGIWSYLDPRCPELGRRMIVPNDSTVDIGNKNIGDEVAYHAFRVDIGVPEVGYDYDVNNTFPHEALYDVLSSVDFTKGCFVGQEVVSRMHHRGTTRRRIVPVRGDRPLVSKVTVEAEQVPVGEIGSVSETMGLARLRLDRAAEATAKGQDLVAGGVRIQIENRLWMQIDLKTGQKTSDG